MAKISVIINLESGKKIELEESEYKELENMFKKIEYIPFPNYPTWPNYPTNPQIWYSVGGVEIE